MDDPGISLEELELAARNHGMPLEALCYPVTPIGLHYLLTHYDIPLVDPRGWRLSVRGLVDRELSLTLEEIRARPVAEVVVTMECAGNGRARLSPRPFSQPWLQEAVGTARWRGTPLAPLLEEAGVQSGAIEFVFTGLDHGIEGDEEQIFARSLTVEQALGSDAILAYEINGQPLPPQHGYPLRMVVPGWYGMTNVKWLATIEAVDEPFTGPQQALSYRIRYHEDEPGLALTRMLPRALMVPPGTPHFPTRHRTVAAGDVLLEGRAWSGWAAIERVDVSADGGRTWIAAELEQDVDSAWAWARWRHTWTAEPGDAELSCRATDGAGNVQPLQSEWNLGGYGNNAVQRVAVTVTPN